MKKQCVCVFFFFEVHSFCCWGENTHICIQLHSWWEARHMVGTRTTRQRKRAAHVAEARERFFQQFIKANKWNETMRKTKRLDRPPAGTVKCCFFFCFPFLPLATSWLIMYRVHYLKIYVTQTAWWLAHENLAQQKSTMEIGSSVPFRR